MKVPTNVLIVGGGVAVVGALAWFMVRKYGGVSGAVAALTGAAADAGAGVVLGIGDTIGLPRTDLTECERAWAEGRYLDASKLCPAKDFFSGAASVHQDPVAMAKPLATGETRDVWGNPTTYIPVFSEIANFGSWVGNTVRGAVGLDTSNPAPLAAPGDSRSDYVTLGSTEAPIPYRPFDLAEYLGVGVTSKTDPRYSFASY